MEFGCPDGGNRGKVYLSPCIPRRAINSLPCLDFFSRRRGEGHVEEKEALHLCPARSEIGKNSETREGEAVRERDTG